MPRTVCILTAGKGTRLGKITQYINKSLLPVAYRPVLSRIIEKFPLDTRFVVAVGHYDNLVRDFITLCYPERHFVFVQVDYYDGPGAGPGRSLLCCKPYLQQPFVLTTCDTLVEEEVPEVDGNWIGVAKHPEVEKFCSVGFDGNRLVTRIDYRQKIDGNAAFIGLAGIRDTGRFWEALEKNVELIFGEHQIANGLRGLLDARLRGEFFTWHDTGTLESWARTNEHYGTDFRNFDKEDEALYLTGDEVIKFFANEDLVTKRVERARRLGRLCPEITGHVANFYKYRYVRGRMLGEKLNDVVFGEFLEWCRRHLWVPRNLDDKGKTRLRSLCRRFYEEKTRKRLRLFFEKVGVDDRSEIINGYPVGRTADLLDAVDWEEMSEGVPVQFHGDLHPYNVVIPDDSGEGPFKLLDWRQDFGGELEFGDWYYDLAKINHALILSHDQIKKDAFEVHMDGERVRFHYLTRSQEISCRKVFWRFVAENGLQPFKIKILTHLIFFNMSPLHHSPFDLLLYYLGKLGLHQLLVDRVAVNSAAHE